MADTLTKDQRRMLEAYAAEAEMRRCAADKKYWVERYWMVESQATADGRALLELWDYQHEIFDTLQTEREIIALKTRQMGFTTLVLADTAHELLFTRQAFETLYVSYTEDMATGAVERLAFGYDNLPQWMRRRLPSRDDNTSGRITFKHRDGRRTRLFTAAGTKRTGASKTLSRVILDEFALMEYQSSVYNAVRPTVAASLSGSTRGAVFVIISTARGARNQFAHLYRQASSGRSTFRSLFYDVTHNRFDFGIYTEDPDGFWARWKQALANSDDASKFLSEYPRTADEALRESGNPRFAHLPGYGDVFPFEHHYFMRRDVGQRTMFDVADPDDSDVAHVHFVVPPDDVDRTRPFIISADPATGGGGDSSAAMLLQPSETPGAVDVLAYIHRSDIDQYTFAEWLNMLGRAFAGPGQEAARLAVETINNSEGDTIARLRQLRYPNLFRYVPRNKRSARALDRYGWPMDSSTKPEAINALARLLVAEQDENGELRPRPKLNNIFPDFLDQLAAFVQEEQVSASGQVRIRLRGDAGSHDDLVLCAAIGAAVVERETAGPSRVTTSSREPARRPAYVQGGAIVVGSLLDDMEAEIERYEAKKAKERSAWQRELRRRERRKR
jgi:hypothetical protein